VKILFVQRIVEFIDPMNVQLLSALAKREGHQTYLTILEEDDFEADLKRIKPDLVALSAITGEQAFMLEAATVAKKYSQNIGTILGGAYTTFYPDIIEAEPLDAIGVGECDDAWVDFLRAYEAGHRFDSIPNIYTKHNWFERWKVASSAERGASLRNRVTFLDDLPFLDRGLVYDKCELGNFPMRTIMSSRGCPFKCTYCFEPKFNQLYKGKGPIYNRYSPQRLCEELSELKRRWPTQFIKFYDDMFVVNRKVDDWLAEFVEIYPKKVGLPFFCLTRCDVLTEENLLALKKAGLHSITMSIEHGNEYIRNKIIRRTMSQEQIEEAFALCEREGIKTFANTILAVPVTKEVMAAHGKKTAIEYDIESLDLNLRCKVTFGEFSPIYPYPGTDLYEYVRKNGFFDNDFDSLHFSYQSQSPMNCFTESEKLMQNNLSLLGTVCLLFPRMRNLIVNHLIRYPLTKLYFLLYFLAKGYLMTFKIYPIRLSVASLLRTVMRSTRIEFRKHAPGKRLYKRTVKMEHSTPKMLGGLPQG